MTRARRMLMGMALLALVAGAAQAQGPGAPGGGPGGPGGGRGNRPRPPQFQLRGTVQALAEMDKGKRCPLTADQAKKIVAVIQPLQKKAKLTDDEAKAADKKIRAVLTVQQLNELSRVSKELRERMRAQMRKQWEAMRQQGGGAPGGAPGAGGPGGPGGRPSGNRSAFKDYNPFIAPKVDKDADPRRTEMMQQGYKRLQEAMAALEKKAKQKK